MTLKESIKALEQIKTYTAAGNLDAVNYIIQVLKKMENEGVKDPLTTDFTKLK